MSNFPVQGMQMSYANNRFITGSAAADTIAFDDAVKVAVDFAKKHPWETLIVVTGDHECGGMTLGFAGTGYETYYEKMANQTIAYDDFDSVNDICKFELKLHQIAFEPTQ